MENEIFVDIENYQGLYQISSYGRVYSVKSKKFLKPHKTNRGYLLIGLHKNGKEKKYLVHRLVASAFLPNPQNLPQINHISEIKTDNRVSNLEFCTASYNMNYGTRNERAIQHPNWKKSIEKSRKPVLQFTKDGKFVKEYPSTHEAARTLGISNSNISKCCRGNKNYSHVGNYIWKFKDVS